MNHSELRDKLDAYYDRELPEREAREMEAHLGSCAPCRRELEDWKSLAQTLLHPPPPSASEAFV
ncbi:MAG: zf-HC2 domain-containing protein, partial [Elusimicrobiota bacterium]